MDRALKTVAARALRAALTLALVFAAAFALVRALPGDPAERLDDPAIPAAQAARTRAALGLDRPPAEQFLRTARAYLALDPGVSFAHRRPVRDVIGDALPASATLGAAALAIAYAGGWLLALLLLALPPRARAAGEALLAVAATVPRFWLGVVLIALFHDALGWLPASHLARPGEAGALPAPAHLVLPALTLALPALALIARTQLAVLAGAPAGARARAARALGIGEPRVLARAIVRPALAPLVALFGLDLAVVVSGAVVVETVFAWPGLGRLAAGALLGADYPLALACVVLAGTGVIAGGLAADALAAWLDPRRRGA